MGTIRDSLSMLFLFLALSISLITAGCASDRSTIRTDEVIVPRGELTGKVTSGPAVPPPVFPEETPYPPNPASGLELLIFTLAGQKVDSVVTGSDGIYSILLPPDIYHVEMSPLPPIPFNIQYTHDLPANVIITEWQETRLDVHYISVAGCAMTVLLSME